MLTDNSRPCTNVGMPVNLSSAPAGQPCNFGLPTYRPDETVTNFQGSVSMADLVQQCSDVGAGISTDGSPSPCSGVGPGLIPSPGSLHSSRPPPTRSPYEWITRPSYQQQGQLIPGRTRTKDKYRTVYTDHQRLELEKEFHYSRYITIRRKTELATMLGLSDRQVKIWFQNRRAKERKQARKKEEVLRKEIDEAQHINSIPAFNIVNKPVSTAINIDSRHYT
ncbi:homeobox protein CDX-1-like [Tachypleus tridentatus]|uniref:homeobox protein CDX-1-like n=1 Tax=Tachypleus tridentatus TaxID=6853 RepID=UPI003FD42A7D